MTSVKSTPAQKAGVVVGQEYVITDEVSHRFKIGDVVILKRDDGTDMPLFEDCNGKTWYVHLSHVKLKETSGPKDGVLWSNAPEGATHYCMNDGFFNKWHKVYGSDIFFYHEGRKEYIKYSNYKAPQNMCVFHFKEVPTVQKEKTVIRDQQEVAQLKEAIRRAEHRLTRQGAKTGRLVERLEHMNKRVAETKEELATLKAKLTNELAKPAVRKITDAKELVELMHNPALWKAGMRVVCRSDEATSITQGEKYTLTKDPHIAGHVSIFFLGDNGNQRVRPAKHYQLVTTDLV